MKITIESTDELLNLDGVPVRRWAGVTERGIACHVFVHRLAVLRDDDCSEFSAELTETPPSASIETHLSVLDGNGNICQGRTVGGGR